MPAGDGGGGMWCESGTNSLDIIARRFVGVSDKNPSIILQALPELRLVFHVPAAARKCRARHAQPSGDAPPLHERRQTGQAKPCLLPMPPILRVDAHLYLQPLPNFWSNARPQEGLTLQWRAHLCPVILHKAVVHAVTGQDAEAPSGVVVWWRGFS